MCVLVWVCVCVYLSVSVSMCVSPCMSLSMWAHRLHLGSADAVKIWLNLLENNAVKEEGGNGRGVRGGGP